MIKEVGDNELSDNELATKFNQTWSEWMKCIRIVPFKMPQIPAIVEEHIETFFPGKWKYCLKTFEKDLEFKMDGENHIKKTKSLMGWLKKNVDTFQKAEIYTQSIFFEVDQYLEYIRTSGRNFSPQFVAKLIQIVKVKRINGPKGIEFTDEYEVDVAIAVCRRAMPVFEEVAEIFKRKHDPQFFIQNELKPNFERMFIDTVNRVQYEKVVAERLCSQLKNPIWGCVLRNLPSIIFKEITSNCMWAKHKATLNAKILLEIGDCLSTSDNEQNGFDLCIQFLKDTQASLNYWVKYFVEQHCHSGSPTHLSTLAKNVLNETIDFLIEKANSTSHTLSQSGKVNIYVWVKEFHAKVTRKVKVTFNDLTMYFQDHELSHLKFFTDEVKEWLERFRSILTQNDLKYSQVADGESAHRMVLKKVAGCTEQCPFCGAQCELTTKHTRSVSHSTHHRPQALRSYRWINDQKAVLDACTYLVATEKEFKNEVTKYELHPYKKYREIYHDWWIPADRSFEASFYWKWFIGNYSSRIEHHFKFAKTDIQDAWKKLQWTEVRKWLITEYDIEEK